MNEQQNTTKLLDSQAEALETSPHSQAEQSVIMAQKMSAAKKAYAQSAKQLNQDTLIIEYLPLVHKIVNQVINYLHPALTRDDFVSAGTIGLIKAARDFNPNHNAEFKTYAYIRIRGAVIDELRSWSFEPTNIKKQINQAQDTLKEMTLYLGHQPSDEELAQKLNISVGKLYKLFEQARAKHFLSIHGLNEDSPCLGDSLADHSAQMPEDRLQKEELIQQLTEAIQELSDNQRRIVILYYHKNLTMKEIAQVLEVTESRISQLHASAIFKLSCKLRQWNDGK